MQRPPEKNSARTPEKIAERPPEKNAERSPEAVIALPPELSAGAPVSVPPAAPKQAPSSGVAEQTRFSLVKLLGKGGTGDTHEAQIQQADGSLKRGVVKVLAEHPEDEPGRLRALVERLRHVEQAQLILPREFVPSSAGRVLIYDYYAGLSVLEMQRRLKRLGRPLSTGMAVEVLVQALEGLQALHTQQPPVFHLSVKPSNVHVGRAGVVRLLDAGVLNPQATAQNRNRGLAVMNTLPYLAPEQLADTYKPQAATDLYALGTVGYELLAGRPLFDGSAARRELEIRVAFGVQDKARALDSTHPGMTAILARVLAANPKDRYESAEAFYQALLPLREAGAAEKLAALIQELEAMPERPLTASAPEATTLRAVEPVPVSTPDRSDPRAQTVQTVKMTPPPKPTGAGVRSSLPPVPASERLTAVESKPSSERKPTTEVKPADSLGDSRKNTASKAEHSSTPPHRLTLLLGSLLLVIGVFWWVDRGREAQQADRAALEQALSPAHEPEQPTSEEAPRRKNSTSSSRP